VEARGDREIDDHHTAEDLGICLGTALKKALAGKEGIARYGSAIIPMDESLASVHVDLSGRPSLVFHLPFRRRKIGDFDTELVREFFQALVNNGSLTIHAQVVYGATGTTWWSPFSKPWDGLSARRFPGMRESREFPPPKEDYDRHRRLRHGESAERFQGV